MLVFDGLESKYELDLCREYKLLKNRKSIGTLQMQNVRSKSKPFIMEMDDIMYNMEKQASGASTIPISYRNQSIDLHSKSID